MGLHPNHPMYKLLNGDPDFVRTPQNAEAFDEAMELREEEALAWEDLDVNHIDQDILDS